MTTPCSSWISSIGYRRFPDGAAYLAVFLRREDQPICNGERIPVALLYGGPRSPIPSWLPGLLKAGTGRRSVGLAFNRLLKGKGYDYTRVEGQDNVRKLKEMLS
jgi:hypothetical protein